MGWSPSFRNALSDPNLAPRFRLEGVKIPAGTLRVFGSNLRLSSYNNGGVHDPIMTLNGGLQGGRLTPRVWTCQPRMATIGFDGLSTPGSDLRTVIQRGQAIALIVSLETSPGVWEDGTIALLSVTQVSMSGGQWQIQARGLEGALESRLTIEAGEQFLCHDLGSTAVDDGSGYDGGATLTVDDTSDFRTDGQGVGVVKVEADDGSTYYVTYTGTTATTFTGCTSGVFGTTYSATADNAVVTECAYTEGHPTEIMARVLTSTGDGTNGSDDILPASWGYGIEAALVDTRDMQFFRSYFLGNTTGSGDVVWLVDAEVENGQSFINTWLNSAGYFLTQRQGELTCRGALEPYATANAGANPSGNYPIRDDDIADFVGYEQWAGSSAGFAEYQKTRVAYADDGSTAQTSAEGPVDHHPARGINLHTLGGLYSDNSNGSNIAAELVTRLKVWDQRTPEVLQLRLRGWRLAEAACGETVKLTTSFFRSRDGLSFTERDALLLSVAPAFNGSSTDVEIAILPADEVVPWRPPSP